MKRIGLKTAILAICLILGTSRAAYATYETDIKCMATAVYYEARGEIIEGQLAVAYVIRNRSLSGRREWPTAICDIVTQKRYGVCQFTYACRVQKPIRKTTIMWARAVIVSYAALIGVPDPTHGATCYRTTVRRPWPKGIRIGHHITYRC